jgi:hypothetical protein
MAWGIIPLMQWISVDLPEPEGPRIRIFSPRATLRFISIRVGSVWALYLKEKFSNTRAGLFMEALV